MSRRDARQRGATAPEERHSALVEALQRIGASLDVETVLKEVLEGAGVLTGARYGIITVMDENGVPQDVVTLGFTEDERQALVEWPDGRRLFNHLRDLPEPLRIPDVPAYARSLGIAADILPSTPFMGTPMRHRGIHVGNFYLTWKAGGEPFTDADEEVLLLFAAQAAAAIVNARAYRDEQRARADLEALIDISPVGVVVFDAITGKPVSFNREARRIAEGIRMPEQRAEDILTSVVCRRADGREIRLAEFPLAAALSNAEAVYAEEIELSNPDGRHTTTLVNATPIHNDDGAVASVVVTLQDLEPLRELERTRAEFLGMVSHELRAPLSSIKGSAATVLDGSETFAQTEMLQFFRIINEQANRMSSLISALLDAGRIESGTLSVAPEPSELADLLDQARITLLSGGDRHPVHIDLPADLPRVMADRQRIVQVLNNLVANAARHSPESSPIRIEAAREGVYVAITVSDQGQGIEPERLAQMFRKYARDDKQRGIGTGLGLAICKGLVEAHGGRIRAASGGAGQGARFTFTLPAADEAGAGPRQVAADRQQRDDGERQRILVVDDDPQTLRYVRDVLYDAGYAASVTGEHENLPQLLKTERPALVLLDLVLPEMNGIELMQNLPELQDLPVLFISAYGRDETVAEALEAGAEDYIVKPFSPTELIARVRTALRRRADPEPFRLGELVIDYDQRKVTVAGREITLTATEYELLRVLSLSNGRVLTHDALLRQVWSKRLGSADDIALVRAYVKRLRRKLGDDAKRPAYIVTEIRVGYRMPRPAG